MSTTLGPMKLICNSRSGGVTKALPVVEAALKERELEYSIERTERAGHAIEIAHRALSDGTRFLVAVGGDGTIHEVVNGIMKADPTVASEAVLGVVAAGTGSDFVKTFGLPTGPRAAVSHLDGDTSFRIDIGKVTYSSEDGGSQIVRYFPNVAEAGLGAEVVARAVRLPRWLGPTVYLAAFWMTIRKFKITQVRVDLVDRTWEGYMNNLVVANGQFFGGGMKIAPKAAPTDGLLDVQIHHARKREAITIMPKIFKGEHVPHPHIEEAKRVKVSIEADRPLRIEADGEVLGYTPATFEVVRDAISLKV
ncbi:MAG TPA: diacylglycerol kinase family protein [Actinomycetota bacterium]|nr:diacylglycerol kinase family protein [Actinomycetota bacterium]